MFGGLCPCPCFGNHRSSDNDKDGPDLDPVLLVSGMGGSILHSKKKKFGFETRVWVRILLADLEFRKKLWSLYNPTTGLSLSLYKWINVYVVVCMCNKCVYVYIFYVCIIGFACKLTWWLTCVFWFFFWWGCVWLVRKWRKIRGKGKKNENFFWWGWVWLVRGEEIKGLGAECLCMFLGGEKVKDVGSMIKYGNLLIFFFFDEMVTCV